MAPGLLGECSCCAVPAVEGRVVGHAPDPARSPPQRRIASPTHSPMRVANAEQGEGEQADRSRSRAPRVPTRKYRARSPASTRVATTTAKTAETTDPADHGPKAGSGIVYRSGLGAGAAADLQNLGARHAFRVRQVRLGDQCAPQGNRIHHAQHAAERTDRNRRPVREAGPPADDHQARAARR